jgi:hypothetical protein
MDNSLIYGGNSGDSLRNSCQPHSPAPRITILTPQESKKIKGVKKTKAARQQSADRAAFNSGHYLPYVEPSFAPLYLSKFNEF